MRTLKDKLVEYGECVAVVIIVLAVCGKPLKIGFPRCPFCNTRLKWKYPFKTKVVDAGSGEKYDR